ncbi:MAG: SCP2 sterol-binding domain-containing protein [Deltaproteobacteria bacterium]|nr:MAG: SCP2 sterol-binding domain-containing protein [Deltaproteobacteria bacterium]
MADDRQKRRQELAATLEGRSDEEITQGVVAQGADTVLGQIFSGMSEAFLPEKAGSQSAVIQYDINVGGTVHTYQLKIAGGKCELVKGAAGPARVTLALQAPDFLRLVTGKLNGMQAFMTGKLKLTGDMMFAQVMQGWFEQ